MGSSGHTGQRLSRGETQSRASTGACPTGAVTRCQGPSWLPCTSPQNLLHTSLAMFLKASSTSQVVLAMVSFFPLHIPRAPWSLVPVSMRLLGVSSTGQTEGSCLRVTLESCFGWPPDPRPATCNLQNNVASPYLKEEGVGSQPQSTGPGPGAPWRRRAIRSPPTAPCLALEVSPGMHLRR